MSTTARPHPRHLRFEETTKIGCPWCDHVAVVPEAILVSNQLTPQRVTSIRVGSDTQYHDCPGPS